jgi:hypothetical protein
MKKLTSADSLITINHYKNLLESEGIPAVIRNEHLGGVLGEMPFTEVWPQLWIMNDLDYDRALQLIDKAVTDESPTTPWTCGKCGEENEGQFSACWKCSAAHTAD